MLEAAVDVDSGSIRDIDETLPSASEITRYNGNVCSPLPFTDRKHNLPNDKRFSVHYRVLKKSSCRISQS